MSNASRATSNNSGGGGRNRKKRKKSSSGKKKFDPITFWGTAESIPTPDGFEMTTPDSVAVVTSLGQPPLPGHGAASPHYFKLVYDRSAQLASALAMAGGIDDLMPEDPPEEHISGEEDDEALDDYNAVEEVIEVSSDDEQADNTNAVSAEDDESE